MCGNSHNKKYMLTILKVKQICGLQSYAECVLEYDTASQTVQHWISYEQHCKHINKVELNLKLYYH